MVGMTTIHGIIVDESIWNNAISIRMWGYRETGGEFYGHDWEELTVCRDRFVKIEGDWSDSRKVMFEYFGSAWAFQGFITESLSSTGTVSTSVDSGVLHPIIRFPSSFKLIEAFKSLSCN
ncbi:MAG: hypothetical protein EZS28_037897, partial [Streblomastix strix]